MISVPNRLATKKVSYKSTCNRQNWHTSNFCNYIVKIEAGGCIQQKNKFFLRAQNNTNQQLTRTNLSCRDPTTTKLNDIKLILVQIIISIPKYKLIKKELKIIMNKYYLKNVTLKSIKIYPLFNRHT